MFYCPCYGKSVKSTSSSFQVRFPSRLLGVRHESSTEVWVQIYCRSWFGLHDVANTHAWNAVVFIWHQCPTTHGASKHTSVNMTAKRPPFFSFFFFFWSPVQLKELALCPSNRGRVLPLLVFQPSCQQLGGCEALWTRRSGCARSVTRDDSR